MHRLATSLLPSRKLCGATTRPIGTQAPRERLEFDPARRVAGILHMPPPHYRSIESQWRHHFYFFTRSRTNRQHTFSVGRQTESITNNHRPTIYRDAKARRGSAHRVPLLACLAVLPRTAAHAPHPLAQPTSCALSCRVSAQAASFNRGGVWYHKVTNRTGAVSAVTARLPIGTMRSFLLPRFLPGEIS
jgi:hypothetical protein